MTTFHWEETREVLAPRAFEPGWVVDDRLRWFEREEDGAVLRVAPPLVFPIAPGTRSIARYLMALPDEPGMHTVVLLQAGAASLGLFDGGEPIATKSRKRYVVRGSGRAQPTHLKTKGKSRYGSRLRLQNAKQLQEETVETLLDWRDEYGPSDRVYYNAPVRLWAEFLEADPPPPFDKDDEPIKIPRDLPRPTTDVMLRAYRSLCYGRVE